MKPITTDDIFSKAALAYCKRINKDPYEFSDWNTREGRYRDELEMLCEKILALKDVGAL